MKRFILMYICFVFFAGHIKAQQPDSNANIRSASEDSIVRRQDAAATAAAVAAQDSAMQRRSRMDTIYRVGFNALDYAMQKRYIPKGRPFVNKKFLDNFFISFYGGYNSILPKTGLKFSGGPEIGLAAMKSFSPKNALRVGGRWSSAHRKTDNERWNSLSVQVDHLYNLSAAFLGYNPYRMFEVSTVEGLGAHFSSLQGVKKQAVDFHLGLQMKLATGTRLDMFFEPGIAFYSDGIDVSENNSHGYDLGYYARLGMNYRLGTFTPKGSKEPGEENFLDNTFVSAGIGMQTQLSSLVKDRGMLASSGPIFSVAAGKWFLDLFGFRLSAFGSYNSWKVNEKMGMDRLSMYAGGRAEAMLNPFAFFRKDVRDMKWGIVPLFGVELGVMKKQDEHIDISKSYTGMTGAVQFKYFPTENFALFVEPRLSYVPYKFIEKSLSGKVNEFSFVDKMMNVTVGIELHRPSRERWHSLAQLRGNFKPYYYTSYALGMAVPQQIHRPVGRRPGFIVGTTVGRQMSPLSGVRLGWDFNTTVTRNAQNASTRYTLTSLSLNYLFDVSNWILGYDEERKFGMEIFAGPVLSRQLDPKKTFFAMEGGVRPYWRVAEQFDIFAESRMRIYSKRFVPSKAGYPGTPFQVSFAMGTAYRFNSYLMKKQHESGFGDGTIWGNTFISGGLGVQSLIGQGRSISLLSSVGPSMSLSVGKWLLPFWGLRFSGFAGISSRSQSKREGGILIDNRTMQGGVRIESMFDVLSIWKYDKDRRWGVIPMMGMEFGKVRRQSGMQDVAAASAVYSAVTAAMQCKYNFSNQMSIFIEPRFTRIPYIYRNENVKKNTIGPRLSTVDHLMSVQMGLEFRYGGGNRWKELAAVRRDFTPYYYVSWNVGSAFPIHRAKFDAGAKLGLSVGLSAGKQILPCSSIRVGFDYTVLPGREGSAAAKLVHASANYLLDLTHIMAGYDVERRFGVEVLGGPMLAFGSEPNKFTGGIEGGLHFYYKLVKGLSVFAEPRMRLYFKNVYAGHDATPVHGLFHIGTTYRF